MDATKPSLTFALLEQKIEAMPEGPVSALSSPRWVRVLNTVGWAGIVIGLLPSLLLLWFAPQLWMVTLSRVGLVLTLAFFPYLLRTVWLVIYEFVNSRQQFVEQFDHDVAQLRRVSQWLLAYPRDVLEDQLRYAKMAQERLVSKLGLLVGGMDKLGLLPLCLSLFVVLRNWRDLLALPAWLSILALFAAILWMISWLGAHFRLRLHLYESVLAAALANVGAAKADVPTETALPTSPAGYTAHRITSLDSLEALYGQPVERALRKQIDQLNADYQAFVHASPFVVLASAGDEGLDCSPRGDAPGFVQVLDARTLALPDRPGNNRVDTLRNLLQDPRLSLLFLIPGIGETLRVNGRAEIRVDPELLARFAVGERLPRSVIVVHIEAVYFHCARAIVRSQLWDPARHLPRDRLPSPGTMHAHLADGAFDADAYDRELPQRTRDSLY
ncbi:pyridoxamine 5'-phosphate oxidase family protein [Xanthomonas indica]|uniref:Pyridoxamine 5'-phosphate oxidase family protein n=1 Tax=Xanthomonas indica TaxID=2912242 RepID=A0AAU8I5F2_9XANT|nr:pyridoxamine 5'-phosphate oxidase family protein [Xanthomonas indica]MCI2263555.1 pyridoxamine 5'-phosphate oxidase family protein [Xanthomonas indica]